MDVPYAKIIKAVSSFFQEILKHLRSLPANELIHKTTLFKDWDVVSPMPWKPGKSIEDFTLEIGIATTGEARYPRSFYLRICLFILETMA